MTTTLSQPNAAGLKLPLPWVTLSLLAIVVLGAFLRFYDLQAIGDGNTYYTAAVKAMLQSPSNFFFAAAEPGGSVTVDKPPLGLWLQALSAAIFGLSGWSVALPQALAGVLALPLLFSLVRRHFGAWAGLLAALILALTPVVIAVERNNTMDGTLILTLLGAAWAFLRATETGRARYLYLGALLVGVAFNIKMLQAFLPLPAFYALYFLGVRRSVWHKIGTLGLASLILIAVSFSWATIVELTPADQRPYIGSSENNSVFDLIIGYNGLGRLLGREAGGISLPMGGGRSAPPQGGQGTPPQGMAGMMGPGGTGEIGTPSLLRLFTPPLVKEVSWLLPTGLLSLLLLIFSERLRFPIGRVHQAVVLWGGWLMIGAVFFSVANFFHAYYLAMLGAPLAALIGIGAAVWWRLAQQRRVLGSLLLASAVALTLAFQSVALGNYPRLGEWLPIVTALAAIGGIGGVLGLISRQQRLYVASASLMILTLVVPPSILAAQTALNGSTNTVLPSTYAGAGGGVGMPFGAPNRMGAFADDDLIAYLEANTQGMRYMLAVPNANIGADIVLKTGRGVLYLGGFIGDDDVINAEGLAALVAQGDLRYVLEVANMLRGSKAEISTWLNANCTTLSRQVWQSGSGGLLGNLLAPTIWECR
ncbi:MAG: glycosyltransferase family 39 protein [Chloroflexi bacterium CFX4]|nr:glycosyltransferase family 39 protein [Chloroflexi bacterium CFX4]MDL1923541.1 glycosyltransferase family 39 protein [Chloroflexi bacterium CFX3]